MRDFIKENLRIQLENLLYEYHENFDEIPDSIRYPETRVRSKEQLIKLSELAKKLNNQYRDIFGGINDGDGTYTFKITKSGNGFLIVHDNGKDDRDYRLGQEGKALRLNANAFGSQGDNSDKTVFFPIVDAKIKLLADDESIKNIMDFDFEGSYTADDQLEKNKELAAEKTPEERGYLKDKYTTRQRANVTKTKNKAKDIEKIEKYNLTPDQQIKIDSLEKDLAKNIRFLNTAKESADYSRKNNEVVPDGVVNRIESLNKEIKRIKSDIEKINPNYGK